MSHSLGTSQSQRTADQAFPCLSVSTHIVVFEPRQLPRLCRPPQRSTVLGGQEAVGHKDGRLLMHKLQPREVPARQEGRGSAEIGTWARFAALEATQNAPKAANRKPNGQPAALPRCPAQPDKHQALPTC